MDYKYLRGTNGSGPAVVAHVQSARGIGSTTLDVDAVTNWPNEFICTTGTPLASGLLDPATLTEFKGHLSGSDIIIDSFVAGYSDLGNTTDQVAVIKPTGLFARELAELGRVSHNDDGTLKDAIVAYNNLSTDLRAGWISAGESWTYASASTITVPTDATTKYDIGDVIKLTQSSTVKYFVITNVAATLLTVSGLTGQTVANSAITANFYSKVRNPHGSGLKGAMPYNPYKFSVYRNSALTINTGAARLITFDTEDFDPNNNFDAVTNNNYTAPIAGFYIFSCFIAFGSAAGSTRAVADLYKNGSTYIRMGDSSSLNAAAGGAGGSALLQLAAGDTIDIRVTPIGANIGLTVGTGPRTTHFEGYLMSVL